MPELAGVATFLGLDAGSFGEVEDRSTLLGPSERARPRPGDRMQRIVEFLGIEFTPAPREPLIERGEPAVPAVPRAEPAVPRREPAVEPPEHHAESSERRWRRVDDDILYQPARSLRRFRR